MSEAGLTVEDELSALQASGATSARAEDPAWASSTAAETRLCGEDADSRVTDGDPGSRPTAEDSGVHVHGDTSVSDAERRPEMRHAVALAISALFVALYVELGDEFFLVAASTALGLVVFWIADQRLGIRSRR